MKDEYKDIAREVLEEGVKQGQAEAGTPLPPITKEERKDVAVKVVAAWYVRLWRYLFG